MELGPLGSTVLQEEYKSRVVWPAVGSRGLKGRTLNSWPDGSEGVMEYKGTEEGARDRKKGRSEG